MSSQIITCPNCGRIIFRYDKKATNAFEVQCRKCEQMTCILTQDGIVQSVKPIKKIQAKSSSGKRFY
jgi:hypothetical protein|uniref:DNA-directed RNA polymerase n=1 Tax=virus sp. ctHG14 TaxID=2827626 RepID=A0A8S5RJT6_9VIRU|nr:MAG TPA: DNA-directed RNA polymerase [virus sp. ctHG14]